MCDQALISNYISGDEQAFTELYRKHYRRSIGFFLKATESDYEANELMARTWAWILENVPLDTIDSFGSLFNAIGLNQVRDYNYHQSKKNDIETPPKTYQSHSFALRDTQKKIQRLPSHYQRVITLYAIRGFSYSEISDIEGITIGNVKARISRARGML